MVKYTDVAEGAPRLAERVEDVMVEIESLGLTIAENKTQAIILDRRRGIIPPPTHRDHDKR
ncbi:hypothetical protein WH47_00044 [Habropoda laboriosa]|uniref:Uncharacterized protein n=2 Tax=Habropoda laboriosa TaxID=597456 RepID=A0A0L7QJR9_9HYME|nr:hypothetical protein WH47_00044 [Habropoda laboriosa]